MTWSRHRLRRSEDFRVITRRGSRAARSHVVVHLAPCPGGEGAPRVGFVVSKKIGNAVIRNRVTRRLREIIRPLLADLPADTGVVVRTLPGIDQVPYAELRDEVTGALRKAAGRLATTASSRPADATARSAPRGKAAERSRPEQDQDR